MNGGVPQAAARRSVRARVRSRLATSGRVAQSSKRVGTTTLQNGSDHISQLLRAWSDGDQRALGELTPIVYAELRRLAHRYMRGERPGHSLQTTAIRRQFSA